MRKQRDRMGTTDVQLGWWSDNIANPTDWHRWWWNDDNTDGDWRQFKLIKGESGSATFDLLVKIQVEIAKIILGIETV